MNSQVLKRLCESLETGQAAALVTLTETSGSTPRKSGSVMAVFQNGETIGSIGGGKVEYTLINKVVDGFSNCENFDFSYSLNPTGELKMICGGAVKGYVNYFKTNNKLVIFGAGHVAQRIVPLAKTLPFDIYVTDAREGFEKYFNGIKKYMCCPHEEAISSINIDENTYIVISTHGHITDMGVLKDVVNLPAKYIGMVGSHRKVHTVKEEFLQNGISKESLDKIYAPIGLKIANNMPEEIAFSIISEILGVKNGLL